MIYTPGVGGVMYLDPTSGMNVHNRSIQNADVDGKLWYLTTRHSGTGSEFIHNAIPINDLNYQRSAESMVEYGRGVSRSSNYAGLYGRLIKEDWGSFDWWRSFNIGNGHTFGLGNIHLVHDHIHRSLVTGDNFVAVHLKISVDLTFMYFKESDNPDIDGGAPHALAIERMPHYVFPCIQPGSHVVYDATKGDNAPSAVDVAWQGQPFTEPCVDGVDNPTILPWDYCNAVPYNGIQTNVGAAEDSEFRFIKFTASFNNTFMYRAPWNDLTSRREDAGTACFAVGFVISSRGLGGWSHQPFVNFHHASVISTLHDTNNGVYNPSM